uniref:Uncharacterized protein n=1 Tax=Candidatus Kentrum sp. SD TaxID=2126332 RepID=A0A450YLN6_9GAMM|nr:MAG: hypothetical protein BECKSD772F_GA0070984_112215 [Candidatus Kentron sp. SD]VFK48255.1 MAG: hypothetical protein BECKSD772E_GA0070983_111816 [Candidatus Kentron sp. SD]VFK80619.1 MAG: hypothetical protein BECKSD772D_GA0070982_113317 [Candidatus Kentron sp. SD]
MIMTPILEEKYRVQRRLAEQSGYDVRKHFELSYKMAVEAAAKYGLMLKYGRREGGEMEPVVPYRTRDGYGCDVSDAG